MTATQRWLQAAIDRHRYCVGWLIRGHGSVHRGEKTGDALRQIEAFEFLFECELKMGALHNR